MTLRPGLPPVPARMKVLPLDARGYPVPRFVEWIDGKPDFRVMDSAFLVHCLRFKTCWVCGGKMGAFHAFVIGPMCAVNRTSSEPPSHRECAVFSAQACPFLSMPKARRREAGMPEHVVSAGVPLQRNPGVALVWVTKSYRPFQVDGEGPGKKGVLIEIGDPVEVLSFAEGRDATPAEVLHSIETGLPHLEHIARKYDGGDGLKELARQRERAIAVLGLSEARP